MTEETAPPAPPPAAPKAPGKETFSAEYVTELRQEIETLRQRANGHKGEAEAARTAADSARADAEKAVGEARSAADQRVIRAELKAEALRAGMVDLDGLKLADLSTVKLNDAGEVEGAGELMEAMKKAKPWLFGAASTSGTHPQPRSEPPKAKLAKDMTPEEWRAARAELLARR
jgi:hypothetical protein